MVWAVVPIVGIPGKKEGNGSPPTDLGGKGAASDRGPENFNNHQAVGLPTSFWNIDRVVYHLGCNGSEAHLIQEDLMGQ
jgi:hypothetical protein